MPIPSSFSLAHLDCILERAEQSPLTEEEDDDEEDEEEEEDDDEEEKATIT